ncbi:MAG TPA: LysR family transcriptional regulator [Cyclobacteriaceae bacterium]|nr:LysR family transcriptional regulator [Cyclobacteriaceae bacterium]
MIEFRDLKLIKEIAATGNMTKAAAKLFLTQPSLSHQLKDIESRLGTQLFLRINKSMVLTPAGERILKAANEILPQLEAVESDVINGITQSKEIRMATKCYTGYHWLPTLMKEFQSEFPEVVFDVITEAMSEPIEYLLKGRIDIAITNDRATNRGIHTEKLFDDEMVLLVPDDHPLASKPFVVAEDFRDQNLIIYRENFTEDFFSQKLLIPEKVTPKRVMKMQLTEARVELVKAGIGVTVLSRWLVRSFLKKGSGIQQVKITKKGLHRSWYLVCLEQMKSDAYIKKFIGFLKEQHLGIQTKNE